ncbi:zinc-binding alcohol dehydrogenase domain-containing protein cipB [Pseudomassariella vexata]|uniref:Zinc-binding alcohol dehydrogenase domain-containing protein cipB n=1 Tax=Pseudomassariella vexata TaxID=1141098 RepID=A0A1Y2DE78_9PEZI|nr:zinc-binding alcohol dehydrogenase domain-containing protein cipB [Pseudomassariella vexata]ORY56965.1 zinc-binding alcohol dehydrogenase domain-containing protein cipB [Pseudomassariella vexata]
MSTNNAAYLTEKGKALEIKPAPYPTPKENEVIVQTRAIAINPVDYALQMMGDTLFPWLQYPHILGLDVSGEVVKIGSNVANFKAGDRVVGLASGAFQSYSAVPAQMASTIPDSVTNEQAAVIPLGLSTASMGLFGKEYLALHYPSINPKPTSKPLLIWGGSTSVGSNAIQVAVSAGYEVITTASPKNFEYVKKLGASQVFDYNSPTVRDDILAALKGKTCAGAMAITSADLTAAAAAADACYEIISKAEGTKFVATAQPPPEVPHPMVAAKFIRPFGDSEEDQELKDAVFGEYLPQALTAGKFRPAPEPEVVGKGLEALQEAMNVLKQGVSAKKIVVLL